MGELTRAGRLAALTARLRAHHAGTLAERMAPVWFGGAPLCLQDGPDGVICPLYDGKRCEAMGCRPSNLCEPAVQAMGALLTDDEDHDHAP